tara:strand:- start:11576 stop:12760 length:1185 start_codon:yes stop_codon:yes gene_type:complete
MVMPFTLHGDMFFVYKYPHFFSHGEWDIYGMGEEVPYYPPGSVLFFAFLQLIYSIIFTPFEEFFHTVIYTTTDSMDMDNLFFSLFLMKLPYLIFDIFLVKTFWRMCADEKSRSKFIVFWALNPIVIYGTYMVGHLDITPTFFVVLACYLSLDKKKSHWACLALAGGALFKVFPILFLPMVICISSRNLRDAFRLLLYGTLPILFLYSIFYLISGKEVFNIYRVLSYQDFQVSLNYFNILLRLCQAAVYALVCYYILLLRFRLENLNYVTISQCFLAVFFAIYWGHLISSTHRYVWFIPFLIFFVQQHQKWRKAFYLLLLIIVLAGLRSRGSCFGIFGPLNPEFFFSLPSIKDVTWYLIGPQFDLIIESLYKILTGIMTILLLKNLYLKTLTHEK